MVLGLMVRPPGIGRRAGIPLLALALPAGIALGVLGLMMLAAGLPADSSPFLLTLVVLGLAAVLSDLGMAGIGLLRGARWALPVLAAGAIALAVGAGLCLLSSDTMPLAILIAGPLLLAAGAAAAIRQESRTEVASVG